VSFHELIQKLDKGGLGRHGYLRDMDWDRSNELKIELWKWVRVSWRYMYTGERLEICFAKVD